MKKPFLAFLVMVCGVWLAGCAKRHPKIQFVDRVIAAECAIPRVVTPVDWTCVDAITESTPIDEIQLCLVLTFLDAIRWGETQAVILDGYRPPVSTPTP